MKFSSLFSIFYIKTLWERKSIWNLKCDKTAANVTLAFRNAFIFLLFFIQANNRLLGFRLNSESVKHKRQVWANKCSRLLKPMNEWIGNELRVFANGEQREWKLASGFRILNFRILNLTIFETLLLMIRASIAFVSISLYINRSNSFSFLLHPPSFFSVSISVYHHKSWRPCKSCISLFQK